MDMATSELFFSTLITTMKFVRTVNAALSLLLASVVVCLGLDITTLDGTLYTGCEIKRVEPDALVLTHSNGTARVAYEKLPRALQTQYFDPAKVAAYRQQQQEAKEAAETKAAAVRREIQEAALKKEQESKRLAEEQSRLEHERRAEAEKQEQDKLRNERQKKAFQFGIQVVGVVIAAAAALWLAVTNFGHFLASIGVITTVYYFFNFDTSVPTAGGQRIHNLGLLQDRQLGCIVGVALFVVGEVIGLAKKKKSDE